MLTSNCLNTFKLCWNFNFLNFCCTWKCRRETMWNYVFLPSGCREWWDPHTGWIYPQRSEGGRWTSWCIHLWRERRCPLYWPSEPRPASVYPASPHLTLPSPQPDLKMKIKRNKTQHYINMVKQKDKHMYAGVIISPSWEKKCTSSPGSVCAAALCCPLMVQWRAQIRSHLERHQSGPQSSVLTPASPWATAADRRSKSLPYPSPWHPEPSQTRSAPEGDWQAAFITQFIPVGFRSFHGSVHYITSGTGSNRDALSPGITLGRYGDRSCKAIRHTNKDIKEMSHLKPSTT